MRREAFAFRFGQICQFGACFVQVLPLHQGFRLGKGVGNGKTAASVLHALRRHQDDKVAGNQARALMKQLEIGVLAVDPFTAEHDAARFAHGGTAV